MVPSGFFVIAYITNGDFYSKADCGAFGVFEWTNLEGKMLMG